MLVQETKIYPNPLPMVKVHGSHRQIGRQIGETFPDQIKHSIEDARELIDSTYETLQLTWESANIQARKYLPFAQERYPQYVDEILGTAEGAGVTFDDLVALNAM
ncbi:MAG TPA: hypothetical protein VMC62_10425, partial [Longilinea sp.]|nr:hypothetical protein [Longilinea sp.]